MLFLIELNLVSMTVLAPNLPVFFQNTSTGGVYFLPGEATGGTKSSKIRRDENTSYALSHVYTGKSVGAVTSQAGHGEGSGGMQREQGGNRASFDSDVILMRRSIEIEQISETGGSEPRSNISGI